MTINLVELIENSDVLLLFTTLAFGLMVGRLRIGGFELGGTTGLSLIHI